MRQTIYTPTSPALCRHCEGGGREGEKEGRIEGGRKGERSKGEGLREGERERGVREKEGERYGVRDGEGGRIKIHNVQFQTLVLFPVPL